MPKELTPGMNLRDALNLAQRLGCKVEHARRTGEVVVSHRDHPRHKVRLNSRRKCAPRALTSLLRKVAVKPVGATVQDTVKKVGDKILDTIVKRHNIPKVNTRTVRRRATKMSTPDQPKKPTGKSAILRNVDPQKCASRMRAVMGQKGIKSQQELARRTGISSASVNKWHNAVAVPKMMTIKKFCEAFNVNVNWLLNGEGTMYENPEPEPTAPKDEPPAEPAPLPPLDEIISTNAKAAEDAKDPATILAEALVHFGNGMACLQRLAKCDLIERPSASELLLQAAAMMEEQERRRKEGE